MGNCCKKSLKNYNGYSQHKSPNNKYVSVTYYNKHREYNSFININCIRIYIIKNDYTKQELEEKLLNNEIKYDVDTYIFHIQYPCIIYANWIGKTSYYGVIYVNKHNSNSVAIYDCDNKRAHTFNFGANMIPYEFKYIKARINRYHSFDDNNRIDDYIDSNDIDIDEYYDKIIILSEDNYNRMYKFVIMIKNNKFIYDRSSIV